MNLTNLFRLHAILAAVYGLGIVLAPQFIVSLLSPFPLNPVGTDIARLFGGALNVATYSKAQGLRSCSVRVLITR